MTKICSFFVVISLLIACEEHASVDHAELYKTTYKNGLIEMCQSNRACIDLIENHFEQCIDNELVDKMVGAAEENKTAINTEIADKTMRCIEQYLPKESE